MNRLKAFIVWLGRIGHCRGFGIQSPADYWLVRYVINEHGPYYSYSKLGQDDDWLTQKLAETDSTYNATGYVSDANGLKSQSYIINRNGTFITHPIGSRVMEGVFFNHLKGTGDFDIELLIEKMKNGTVSEKESEKKFLFYGQESYLFFTPLKYTDWMMVTVVPCRTIDMLGITYGFQIIVVLLLAMLSILILNFLFIWRR